MPMESRSSVQVLKRAEQLKRWEASETNKISSEISKDKLRKIQFSKGCIFLACCAAGDLDEVEHLLENGVDINTSNVDGLTALHQACIDNNLEMVEFLVSHGCDVNFSDFEGWTPLHAAASCGLDSIVKYLIEHGGDVAAVNNEGALPIDITDTPEVAALLQSEMDRKGVDQEAARQIEERQMREDLQHYLDQGGNFMDLVHPRTGATPLHVAAAKGYLSLISQLLEAGADPNKPDLDGWTSLHAAAHWGQKEVCELLALASSADMTINNHVGQTCIDIADEDLVDFLQDLQKRQTTARLEANERQRETILQQQQTAARPAFVPPPLKRRTSVNRMSVADKSSVILKATIAERAPFADGEETEPSHEDTPSPPVEPAPVVVAPPEKTPPSKEPPVPMPTVQPTEQQKPAELEIVLPPTPPDNRVKTEEAPPQGRRSLVPSNREESSEAQRKAHAKRVRETRRSTQGVTLEDIKSAEQQLLAKKKSEAGETPAVAATTPSVVATTPAVTPATPSVTPTTPAVTSTTPAVVSATPAVTTATPAVTTATPAVTPATPAVTPVTPAVTPATPAVTPATPAVTSTVAAPPTPISADITTTASTPASTPSTQEDNNKPGVRVRPKPTPPDDNKVEEAGKDNAAGSGDQAKSAAISRRRRPKRRSTGVAYFEAGSGGDSQGDGDKTPESTEEAKEDSPEDTATTTTATRPERKNYKKLYEEMKEENHQLQERLRRVETQLEEVKTQLRHNLRNNQVNSLAETDKKKEKRALERKISELEEEVKEVEKLRKTNDKLKMENGALVRVVSRLSMPSNQKLYS